ncbi:MAG: hypothetical protein ACP5MD_09620, partial [Verrucomicrobiia bacterium]
GPGCESRGRCPSGDFGSGYAGLGNMRTTGLVDLLGVGLLQTRRPYGAGCEVPVAAAFEQCGAKESALMSPDTDFKSRCATPSPCA